MARIAETAAATASASVLSARDVGMAYGGTQVLESVSVDVTPSMVTGIIGPNGSGKTTLLKVLAGLLRPQHGEALIGDSRVHEVPAAVRARQIAYLPQTADRHPFTALDLVLMGRYPHLGRFQLEGETDRTIAMESMQRTGTIAFADRQMDTLSGGERQRVALARVLAQRASVLLLDEPTASLDLKHQLLTMETVRREAEGGAAVAVVMHDLSLAARSCERLLLLGGGPVLAEGTPWEVLKPANLRHAFGVEAAVDADPVTGRPSVTLLGTTDSPSHEGLGTGKTVHIICGAGSGRDLLHQLVIAGFTVTACVLGEGDADRETALRLGVRHIRSAPFSVISTEQDAEHRELVCAADIVVLCDMAVGPGNLPNLVAAGAARRLLMVRRPAGAKWDYSGGEAARLYEKLAATAQLVERSDVLRASVGY